MTSASSMQSFQSKRLFPTRTLLLVAAALVTPVLAGCACEDNGWQAVVAANAETAALPPVNCDFSNLNRLSKVSATLAQQADPRLLEIARLEAERDCYKAAVERARQRT